MLFKLLLLLQKTFVTVLTLLIRIAPEKIFPVMVWSPPEGPSSVGVRDIQFTDQTRNEPDKPGHKRELMARIWYPAQSVDGLQRRRWISAGEYQTMALGNRVAMNLTDSITRRLSETLTWSYEDAPLLNVEENTLPVLIFSHGFSGFVGQNTQLCEYLASHGYLVISLAHPYSAGGVYFPDGTAAILSTEIKAGFDGLTGAAMDIIKAKDMTSRKVATHKWSMTQCVTDLNDVWVDDTQACLDIFEGGDSPYSEFSRAGNFSKVGAFGMSLGGSTSAAVAQGDPRILAAINLDGGQARDELFETHSRVPLLMLHSDNMPLFGGGGFNDFYYEPGEQAGLGDRVFRAFVMGTGHMDFSDFALLSSRLFRTMFGMGKADGRDTQKAIATACLAFFDACVKFDTGMDGFDLRRISRLKVIDMASVRECSVDKERAVKA